MRSVFVVVFALISFAAAAHGPAGWIQRGGFKNAVGELCCGERDCRELPKSDVVVTPQGYFIKSLNETVPFSEATPLPALADEFRAEVDQDALKNGQPLPEVGSNYWVCIWGGKRKCFFAPTGAN